VKNTNYRTPENRYPKASYRFKSDSIPDDSILVRYYCICRVIRSPYIAAHNGHWSGPDLQCSGACLLVFSDFLKKLVPVASVFEEFKIIWAKKACLSKYFGFQAQCRG